MSEEAMTLSNERLAEIRQKVREEVMRSAAILRPEELAITVDDVLGRTLQALRASSGVEVKQFPAGWLIRENEHDLWDFCRLKKAADDLTARGYEVIPLYTSPLPTVEVTEEMVRRFVNRYREMWPGAGWPVFADAVDLLTAALSQNKGEG